ncbi:MAG: hypothetical protein HY821_04825 [Acidobacteria bacterium]|nr:hypothetical protein [Acidobacteriota bacterium]
MNTILRAGALTAEWHDGALRHIRYGSHEILSRIYFAVRDSHWGTLPAELSNVELDLHDRTFRISCDAEFRQAEIHFRARISMEGHASGQIGLSVEGAALTTFLKNRIGFCVLHPAALAGSACRIEQNRRHWSPGEFPLLVSPHQPFLEISAIRHSVADGVEAEVRFSGDVFEMEDQRNWTDASFKIYSTPLRLPFPAEITAGTEVRQSVTLSLLPAGLPLPPEPPCAPAAICVQPGPGVPLPALGTSLGAALHKPEGMLVERLRPLRFAYLRTDIDFRRKHGDRQLAAAARAAAAARLPLEVALLLTRDGEEELWTIATAAKNWKVNVVRWLILPVAGKATSKEWMISARRILGGSVPLVAGTGGYFADLNRNRIDAPLADGFVFSANPQVHAVDNDNLMVNASGPSGAVATARDFGASKTVHVSPITFRPRTTPADPRQRTPLAALFTLIHLRSLALSGAASATYYELAGPNGFISEGGEEVFPLWHLFRELAEFSSGELLPATSSLVPEVDAVAIRCGLRTRLWLVNWSESEHTAEIDAAALGHLKSARAGGPVAVPPQSWATLDFELAPPPEDPAAQEQE